MPFEYHNFKNHEKDHNKSQYNHDTHFITKTFGNKQKINHYILKCATKLWPLTSNPSNINQVC